MDALRTIALLRGFAPMAAPDDDFVTVMEAATLLRVAPSTVRRWIREGGVPAYRLGQRRVALRRADSGRLITPVRGDAESAGRVSDEDQTETPELTPEAMPRAEAMALLNTIRQEAAARREQVEIHRLTPEEKRQAQEAMKQARKLREEITARRGGKPFSPSWVILNDSRDERTRQLMSG